MLLTHQFHLVYYRLDLLSDRVMPEAMKFSYSLIYIDCSFNSLVEIETFVLCQSFLQHETERKRKIDFVNASRHAHFTLVS